MRQHHLITLLGCMLFLAASAAPAQFQSGPIGPIPIENLVGQADLILVGTVQASTESVGMVSLTVRVDEVLQGSAQSGDTLRLDWHPDAALSPRGLAVPVAKKGVFFAKMNGTGVGTLIPTATGAIYWAWTLLEVPPELSGGSIPFQANDTAVEKVIRVLARSLRDGEPYVRWLAALRLMETAEMGKRAGRFPPALLGVFDSLAASNKDTESLLAVEGLLTMDEPAGLTRLESTQERHSDNDLRRIANVLEFSYQNDSSGSIEILIRLATTAENLDLRQGAAGALARIHTTKTLPTLAELLNSPNPKLRAYAAGGFSRFANNISSETNHPEPGSWPYRSNETMAHSGVTSESKVVQFWQRWWNEIGRDIVVME